MNKQSLHVEGITVRTLLCDNEFCFRAAAIQRDDEWYCPECDPGETDE